MRPCSSLALALDLCLAVCLAAASALLAQSPSTNDNPPSGDPAATNPTKPAAPPQSGSNPFPEDTSNIPVMPSRNTPAQPEGTWNGAESAGVSLPGDDFDPVRSPDDPAWSPSSGQQESSSSLNGMENLLPRPEDDQPDKKKKLAVKQPTHQEAASKDLEIGAYYLETKNWKAALSRFQSALVLDPENPEVYWGLAEAEHHLGKYTDAKANYLKLLDYDPDGPHGKQARKELKDPALASSQNAPPAPPLPDASK